MAKVYITEYATLARGVAGPAPVPLDPPLAEQTVTIGVEAKSSAFNAATRYIRVHADAICSVSIDANPTATTSMGRMAANQTEYRGVSPGHKISVISNT